MTGIRSTTQRPRQSQVDKQDRTQDAARSARQSGLIDDKQMRRMTDGTVSPVDVQIAQQAVERARASGDPDQLRVAQQLEAAVRDQMKGQNIFETAGENVKDTDELVAEYKPQMDEMLGNVRGALDSARGAKGTGGGGGGPSRVR